ncbi:MAG: discoidin domain-containing protein, partial [Clostridia bacterium]|nr:discoidin domain-containing protein [Clostridia bacterium]
SGVVNAAGWDPSKLNNGTVDASGGFTSEMNPARAYAGYKFTNKTTLNKLVLYSASLGTGDAGVWSGLPKSYTVMYTNDGGLSWNVAASGTNATVPNGQEPMTITFDPIVATEIRVYADELYAKVSDFNNKYLQLAEMEVWYTDNATELAADGSISAYLQTRPATDEKGALVDGYEDLRIVLVGDMEKLAGVKTATVNVTFTLTDGSTKTLTRVLGGANSQYRLYKEITAAGETYVAAEGCAIFGNVITDIPVDAYTALSIEIVDNDTSDKIYQGYAN